MRKFIVIIVALMFALGAKAQYTPALPNGFTPFATQLYYKITGSDTTFVEGATGRGFHYIVANWAMRDSLLTYAKRDLSNVNGTLSVSRGGTGITSYTTGNYIRASGSTTLQQRTPAQVASDIGAITLTALSATAPISYDNTTGIFSIANGAIANAKLTNSSITIGSTAISLGASSTTLAGLTSVTSTSFTGALTGNASTATSAATLTTTRTIWGQNFDGSANITGALTGATTGAFSSNVTVGGTLGVTGVPTFGTVIMLANTSTNTNNIGAVANNPNYLLSERSGFWGIRADVSHGFNIDVYNGGSQVNAVNIAQSGTATFSSSVTANIMKIGEVVAGFAGAAHSSNFTSTDYALLQGSAGNTYLNSKSGQPLSMRINNADAYVIDASKNHDFKSGTATFGGETIHTYGQIALSNTAGGGVPSTGVGFRYNGTLYVYPGSNAFAVRNNANTRDNLLVKDGGTTAITYNYSVAATDLGFSVTEQSGYGIFMYGQNTLNFHYGVNSDSEAWLNYTGYQASNSRFRTLKIGNGKHVEMVKFDGTNGKTTFTASSSTGNVALFSTAAAGVYTSWGASGGLRGYVGTNDQLYSGGSASDFGLLAANRLVIGVNAATATVGAIVLETTGAATFASTLGIGGVADNVKGGTYTPTYTGVANVSSLSSGELWVYHRIGNVMYVDGALTIQSTAGANASTTVDIDVPITMSGSTVYGLGDASSVTATGASITYTSTTKVRLFFQSITASTNRFQVHFAYHLTF